MARLAVVFGVCWLVLMNGAAFALAGSARHIHCGVHDDLDGNTVHNRVVVRL